MFGHNSAFRGTHSGTQARRLHFTFYAHPQAGEGPESPSPFRLQCRADAFRFRGRSRGLPSRQGDNSLRFLNRHSGGDVTGSDLRSVLPFHPIADADFYAPIAEAWDFSRAKVVADLGGGGGSLILALLSLNPHLRGMLVDLESSVDAAKTRFAEEDPSSRCELIAADLTKSVPAGADVYMIKHVLHGRQDGDAITILKNCRAVIPQNGSLLIIEFILPPLVSHADPQLEGHLMSDLNMLAVTGGKERSEREWRTLLEASGFILTGVYPVGGDNLMVQNVGILEAKPA
jgi:hypothetical protein